jgi:dolichol-phosphate mannosyltransferase
MSGVSLIVPETARTRASEEDLDAWREILKARGYDVDGILSLDQDARDNHESTLGWRVARAGDRGLAAAAVHGIGAARQERVVIVDPGVGYRPQDLLAVVEALEEPAVELAIACRTRPAHPRVNSGIRSQLRSFACNMSEWLFGTSDPFSGLVAFRRGALECSPRFGAVGSRFTFELLTKLEGPRRDVPVERTKIAAWRSVGWDEIRHLKRLADHRFGNLSRLVQFCLVGASGMVVDLSCYASLQVVFGRTWLSSIRSPVVGMPASLSLAAALSILIALGWNFSLNRRLAFSDSRRDRIGRQFLAYAASNALAILLSFSLRLWLPKTIPWFDAHKLAAAVVGIVAATGLSFSLSRFVVFRSQGEPPDRSTPDESHVPDRNSRPIGPPHERDQSPTFDHSVT